MFIKEIKKYSDNILPLKFYKFLERIGLSPNKLTLIALFFKILVLYFFYNGQIVLGGIFIVCDYLFDYMDGTMARRLDKVTPFGTFYDTVLDRFFRTAGWPLSLAFGNIITFKIAALVVAFNLLLIFSSSVVESYKLRHFPYMLNVFYLIPYGALLNQVELFATLEAIVAFILLIFNTITIIVLNFNYNSGSLKKR
ncbi:MAG: CDP-alcohol phosphatidyltransferase family protein [Patescibacteria group bacterium]|jgi:phosphatidylglycerophosphate synthase